MLLWETICHFCPPGSRIRLPGDVRCAAMSKSGTRCRGRVLRGSEYCAFHDPEARAVRRARPSRPQRRTQYHLDGIPSRLTTRKGITQALDRLYNDTRTGLIAPEAGRTLFHMLERLLDTHVATGSRGNGARDRSRAARLRRQLAKHYIAAEQRVRGAQASGDQGRFRPALERPLSSGARGSEYPPRVSDAERSAAGLLGPAVPHTAS